MWSLFELIVIAHFCLLLNQKKWTYPLRSFITLAKCKYFAIYFIRRHRMCQQEKKRNCYSRDQHVNRIFLWKCSIFALCVSSSWRYKKRSNPINTSPFIWPHTPTDQCLLFKYHQFKFAPQNPGDYIYCLLIQCCCSLTQPLRQNLLADIYGWPR